MSPLRRRRIAVAAFALIVAGLVVGLLIAPVVGMVVGSSQDIADLGDRLQALRDRALDTDKLQRDLSDLRSDPLLAAVVAASDRSAPMMDPSAQLAERLQSEGIQLSLQPEASRPDEDATVLRRRFSGQLSVDAASRFPALVENGTPPWFFEEVSASRTGDGSLVAVAGVLRSYRLAPETPKGAKP